MLLRSISLFILVFVLSLWLEGLYAQPAWSFRLLDSSENQKPKQFEDYQLGSEKAADKKFTRFRHFTQNNITHFNYYFNANAKINKVVDLAIASQKDDYTKLLSFYPYSLEKTASQKRELDSVISKCTAGILLHDLRNDWIDNLYLLMGEAYFYKKDFDSANAFFQFINYNLFPRNKDDDDDQVVGSNDNAAGNSISIANKEKQNIFQKIASQPPSRNDALVWLIRTQIEQGAFGESAGIINTLQNDPNFPKRLKDYLEEVDAYWFFKQEIYDSAASHLEKSLTTAKTKSIQPRSEYLLAQLYEMTKRFDKASVYYKKASQHTTDPLMDIHAQLNNATMLRSSKPEELDRSMNNLLRMAQKDRFEAYRDILYYSAAQLAIQKPDTAQAVVLLTKSTKYNEADVIYKNKAFLQLADISYNQKKYKQAFAYYDSLQSGDTSLAADLDRIHAKRNSLVKIVEQLNIIDMEDSLQRIAAMPKAEREAFVRNLAKKLTKQKEEVNTDYGGAFINNNTFGNNNNQLPGLTTATGTKGTWYFNNAALKAKGYDDFKAKWGKRPNTDNWRRSSALDAAAQQASGDMGISALNPDIVDTSYATSKNAAKNTVQQPADNSFVGLMSNLPLTPERLKASNEKIAKALFTLANLYQSDLEDYQEAIATYQESLKRFPDSLYDGQIYLGMYYCYTKLGNKIQADYYKKLLSNQFPGSHAFKLLSNPSLFLNTEAKDPVVTKHYEEIYNLFIEGKFKEASDSVKAADSLYGINYWSPQLLYIESIAYIKEHDDSTAKNALKNLIRLYPKSPMRPKAERLINVLNRRASIEQYLTNLQVKRMSDSDVVVANVEMNENRRSVNDTTRRSVNRLTPKVDSVKKEVASTPINNNDKKNIPVGDYSFDSSAVHDVVMVLENVDGVFVNEAKNAMTRFRDESYLYQNLAVSKMPLDSIHSIVVFSSFHNVKEALVFCDKIKKAAPDEVSWLPVNKYSFIIISEANLELLKEKKNLKTYKTFLNGIFPNRF